MCLVPSNITIRIPVTDLESSGILKSLPVNEMVYTLKDGDKEPDPKNAISLYLKSKGGFSHQLLI